MRSARRLTRSGRGSSVEECEESTPRNDADIGGKIIRRVRQEDEQKARELNERELEAHRIGTEKIAQYRLDMKLVDVEYLFDGKKVIFYFTAAERVDFRELVRDLARLLKTRIEMRQVGVRDEAKMIGGLGPCGRDLCCATFLHEFQPVTIRMAKDQGLPLNPLKISGLCGRLMCCLKYENDQYREFRACTPVLGEKVRTPHGVGTVVEHHAAAWQVVVELSEGRKVSFPMESVERVGGPKRPCVTRVATDEVTDEETPA